MCLVRASKPQDRRCSDPVAMFVMFYFVEPNVSSAMPLSIASFVSVSVSRQSPVVRLTHRLTHGSSALSACTNSRISGWLISRWRTTAPLRYVPPRLRISFNVE